MKQWRKVIFYQQQTFRLSFKSLHSIFWEGFFLVGKEKFLI